MTPSPALFPPARVTPHLSHAFRGIFRLTLSRYLAPGRWIGIAAALALLALFALAADFGPKRSPGHFFAWAGGFYLTFMVPLFAFITAGGAMRDEMKSSSVDYVLTRPVPRPAFLGFKFISQLACSQIDFLIALAVVVIVGFTRDVPGILDGLPRMLLAQVLMVTAFTAFGFFAAVVTSRYVVVGLVYAAVIEAAIGQIPTQLNKLSMTHQARSMLNSLMAGGGPPFAPPAGIILPDAGMLATTAIVLAFTVFVLVTAAAIFGWRELSAQADA